MEYTLHPYYLTKAKALLSLKRKPQHTDKLLAHLLQIRTIKKEITSKELTAIIIQRIPTMSIELLRKTIHELREDGILLKENNKYTLNIN